MTTSPPKKRKWKSRQSRHLRRVTFTEDNFLFLLEFCEKTGFTLEEAVNFIVDDFGRHNERRPDLIEGAAEN